MKMQSKYKSYIVTSSIFMNVGYQLLTIIWQNISFIKKCHLNQNSMQNFKIHSIFTLQPETDSNENTIY